LIILKTPSQINKIEYANKIGSEFLQICWDRLKPGFILTELNELAIKFCEKHKVKPAFYKYGGFPYLVCVSVNEEIVHGFPEDREIKSGDIVSIDFGVNKDGYISDSAFTKIIGKATKQAKKIVRTTEECMYLGIEQARFGNRLFDISKAIQSHAFINDFDVIRDYSGHGVGIFLHEMPKVTNFKSIGVNWQLRVGMVIAIEPMLVCGTYKTSVKPNKWTVLTADGELAAHFEHSVAIMEDGPMILSNKIGGEN